jgi:hypothetical protein
LDVEYWMFPTRSSWLTGHGALATAIKVMRATESEAETLKVADQSRNLESGKQKAETLTS